MSKRKANTPSHYLASLPAGGTRLLVTSARRKNCKKLGARNGKDVEEVDCSGGWTRLIALDRGDDQFSLARSTRHSHQLTRCHCLPNRLSIKSASPVGVFRDLTHWAVPVIGHERCKAAKHGLHLGGCRRAVADQKLHQQRDLPSGTTSRLRFAKLQRSIPA